MSRNDATRSRISTILSLAVIAMFTMAGFAIPFYQSVMKPDTVTSRTTIVLFPTISPSLNISALATMATELVKTNNPENTAITSEGNSIVFYNASLPRSKIVEERKRRNSAIKEIDRLVAEETEKHIKATKDDSSKFTDNAALYIALTADRDFLLAHEKNIAPYISEPLEKTTSNRKTAIGAELGAILGFMFGVAFIMAVSEFRRYPWNLI